MGDSSGIYLGGVPISLRRGAKVEWRLTMGVQPFETVVDTNREIAREIFARANAQYPDGRMVTRVQPIGPLDLRLVSPTAPERRFFGVYVSSTAPSSNHRNGLALVLTDRRAQLPRIVVDRAYNVRKGTGDKRVVSGTVTQLEVAKIAADVTYRRASLKGGERAWTAKEVLDDVLTALFGPLGFVYDVEPKFEDPIEDLYLHGQGDEVLQQVLATVPGVQIYIGYDGKCHVTSFLGGEEISQLRAAGAPLEGSPSWVVVDRSNQRPPKCRIFYDIEAEARFDHLETTYTIARGREPMVLENVLPCPDPQLVLADGRVVTYGTIITFDEALAAWADTAVNGNAPLSGQTLTQQLIRESYMRGLDTLHGFYGAVAPDNPDPTWLRRINAVIEHWRSTFRVLPQWMDKIRTLRAIRVAIVDPENGTRAKSDAFYDHIVVPTVRGMVMTAGSKIGWQVTDSWNADLANSSGPGPAIVAVVDSDQGLIQLTQRTDLAGKGSRIVPGNAVSDLASYRAGELIPLLREVALAPFWRLAVVLTATKDVPNDESRMWSVEVTPEEAAKALGSPVEAKRNGLTYEVLTSDDTARFAWLDEKSEAIKESFYSGTEMPKECLVNGEILKDIARAHAARIYASYRDRAQGMPIFAPQASMVPIGSLQQVVHFVLDDGGQGTQAVMPPLLKGPSTASLLPQRTRRLIRGLVQS